MIKSRPESVLVVVHTQALDCLLLKRVTPVSFWQSVTGTLRWDETPAQTAAREVQEETGLDTADLIDAQVQRCFPILPEWRDRYGAGVTENLEHLWYLRVEDECEIILNFEEHTAYQWLPLEVAVTTVTSWTNREALERLRA
ncbi:MAG: dihydroneopterin triphosphate diphosphatase [Candidatus Rariloculaceae bacterium]